MQTMNDRNWPEIINRMVEDGGMTTTEIGAMVGISSQSVHLYKVGKGKPSRPVQLLFERHPQLKKFLVS
ncbi:unnamed protein product [marine sediment metagenome]|uniref:HTH cro/C1-type domain-containing protein n=1 Tax=marine sediment metagenome TaxID=412755 RepID=X1FV75_9ZZZZ